MHVSELKLKSKLYPSPVYSLQENVVFSTPHLREDLSLTSDDGNEVLNDDCP